MNRICLLGFIVGFLYVTGNCQDVVNSSYYYYGKDKKCYLELDKRYVFVSVADEKTAEVFDLHNLRQQPLRADIPEIMQSEKRQQRFWTKLSMEDNLSETAYIAKLSEIKNRGKDIIVSPYFKDRYQDGIGLSNFFYVKLKSLSDTILLKQETEKENMLIVYQNQFMPLWFVVSITEKSNYNAMEAANYFYELGLFQYAEPDLMFEYKVGCANDSLFPKQWWVKNTGQYGGSASKIDTKACEAWELATGANVTVAVLDLGLELGIDTIHPDLAPNIHPLSFDSETKTVPQRFCPDCNSYEHGTRVSGLIGSAKNNNSIGIAGIASDCKLMIISNYFEANTLSRMSRADGINWAWRNGADVLNNSWGFRPLDPNLISLIDEAIDSAVTHGRGGKGCVLLACSHNQNYKEIHYPANLPNVIAVGAIDTFGFRANFSNYGTDLDISAPGLNIVSTDVGGGYTHPESTCGTSFSTPVVSGFVALMLEIDPNLTWQEVKEIIESTAQKTGGYNYQNTPNRPNGTWNENLGYGTINGHKAVLKTYFYRWGIDLPLGENVSLCTESQAYLSGRRPDLTTILWKTSTNIEILGGDQLFRFRGISVGTGWIECYVVRHDDTVLVDKKTIQINYDHIGTLYDNFSTSSSLTHSGTPATIKGTFTVNSGDTVTFMNCTVYCDPDANIIVKAGGKLIVDGGILTDACGQLWQGIEVRGNYSLGQLIFLQGSVELYNNSRIENAICGILAGEEVAITIMGLPFTFMTSGGGIVKAEDAFFINNKRAISFVPYTHYSNSTLQDNGSYFKNCEFVVDNNAFFAKAGKAQAELQGVNNISFTNCHFVDYRTKTSTDDYTTGIYANVSSIRVGNLPGNPLNGACSFSGFGQAIHISSINNNSSKIYSSIFTNNNIGIVAEGTGNLSIGNCQFQIPPPLDYLEGSKGIYLRNAFLYGVENNIFSGEDREDGGIGISIENSGEMNHFVKSNTFENLCGGCLAIGNNSNGYNIWASQGLVYQCNRFANNEKDIWVAENSQIRYRQCGADIKKASGNVFDNRNQWPPRSKWNIYYESAICRMCYHFIGNSPQAPGGLYTPYNNVEGAGNMTSDSCCISYGYGGDNYYLTSCMPMGLGELEDRYMELVEPNGKGYSGNGSGSRFINDTVNGGSSRSSGLDEEPFTDIKQEIDLLCYAALAILTNDETGLDIALYHIWLERFGTIEADYLLVDSYLALGEYAQAATLLNVMPSKFPTLNLGTHQNYLEYSLVVQEYSILEEEQEIPPHLVSEVIRLSSIDNIAGIKAYSLGELIFSDWTEHYPRDISYPGCNCDSSSPSQKSASANDNDFEENPPHTSSSLAEIKTEIILQPNPTKGELQVIFIGSSIEKVIVYDVVGKELMRVSDINSPQTTLNATSLHAGIYFLKIIAEDGAPYTKKFVKH